MSKKSHSPAGKNSGASSEQPDQDESGKTEAPKSETGGPERTKRGEEDRKHEDEEMLTGEPVEATKGNTGGTQAANTTKDKSVEPAKDNRGRGSDKKS